MSFQSTNVNLKPVCSSVFVRRESADFMQNLNGFSQPPSVKRHHGGYESAGCLCGIALPSFHSRVHLCLWQVALGGSYRAAGAGRRPESGERRHPTVAMGSLAVMLASLAALAVVAVTVVDERENVVLGEKGSAAVHSLHFINSLHPEEAAKAVAKDGLDAMNRPAAMAASADAIVGNTHDEQLASAKLAAQNRLDGAKLPKSVQAESREELKLKQELDASVAAKEQDAMSRSSNNMKSILAEAAAAKRAKDLKVRVTNVDSQSGGDSSEEAALRKQLDDDARKRQANMLMKAEPGLKEVRGRRERMSVAASHLARKAGKQLSESALEAELRNQLNSKVKNEESSMFKTAVNHWLGKNTKTSGHAGTRGRSAHRGHAAATVAAAAAAAGSSESKSLVMAETMMKHELNLSKQPARDTTLNHSSLRTAQKQSAARKQHGLGQLEQAMLKSSMSKARKDGPAIHKQHEMMHKLKEAAREKRQREAASKPSYKTAMNKFTARLMHKEVSARHRFLKPANQQGTVDKRALESAIKKRVRLYPLSWT